MTNEALLALEKRINELKALYENYFAGIERREPLRQRESLQAELRKMHVDNQTGNTQLMFRLNNLRARYATLESHWNRVVQQIEEGTYRRRRGGAPPSAVAAAAPATATAVAATTTATAAATAQAKAPPGMSEVAMRDLYKSYAEARAKSGEAPISFDAMVASLKKQVPQVIERFKCKSVDFKVAQKDGKTIIKAVPIT